MFHVTHKPRTVWWPVTFEVPAEEGGGRLEFSVEVRLRLMTRTEMREALRDSLPGDENTVAALLRTVDPKAAEKRDRQLADRVLDWRNVADEHGEPLPFSREALLAVMDMAPAFAAALDQVVWQLSSGNLEGAR